MRRITRRTKSSSDGGCIYQYWAPQPSFKRLKRSPKSGEGKRGGSVPRKAGRLKRLLDSFPVEIVFEICTYLTSRDLLHLGRSSCVFARFLLTPSAELIWKLSRERHEPDLPPVHPDLTERKYAHLAFGSHCQKCGSVSSTAVNWYLRMRWCGKCRDTLSEPDDTYCCFDTPQIEPEYRGRAAMISQFVTHVSRTRLGPKKSRRCIMVYLATELEATLVKMKTSTDKEWAEFVSQKKEEKAALVSHANLCDTWSFRRAMRLREEMRKQRQASIRNKLKKLGFLEKYVDDISLDTLPRANIAKPLSSADWIDMSDSAIGLITEHAEVERLKYLNTLQTVITVLYASWYECRDSKGEFWPFPYKFTEFAPLADILNEALSINLDVFAYSAEVQASDLHLDSVTGRFQELASEFSSMLLASIPRDLRLDTTRATLALARTTFASLIHDTKVDWYPFQASNAHELEFNITASNVISDLISAAGWDPGSMTASQMDDVDIRVECVTCARTYGYIWKPIMPWRYVYAHVYEHSQVPDLPQKVDWRFLGYDEKQCYIEEAELMKGMQPRSWACVLCHSFLLLPNPTFSTKAAVLEHLASEHPAARPDVQTCYTETIRPGVIISSWTYTQPFPSIEDCYGFEAVSLSGSPGPNRHVWEWE